jgi:hypothetical protein
MRTNITQQHMYILHDNEIYSRNQLQSPALEDALGTFVAACCLKIALHVPSFMDVQMLHLTAVAYEI